MHGKIAPHFRKYLCVSALVWASAFASGAPPDPSIFEDPRPVVAATTLDKLVFTQLARLDIQPRLCSDSVFVRRVYLDVTGCLPTAQQARDFIQDPDSRHKRLRLIARLLDSDEFARYWTMKWGDILRIKAEFPVNLWPDAAQAYSHWVYESLRQNMPYDQFARELLTSSGSNFRVAPVNFYRAIQDRTPEGIARTVALTFMGTRAELWPSNRLAGMAVFFSQIGYKATSEWKEQQVFWDPLGSSAVPGNSAPGQASIAALAQVSNVVWQVNPAAETECRPLAGTFPDGSRVQIPSDRDPRQAFADWLITPDNPWFTRCIVNRVWAWLLGRGIIQEPDDIRDDNPPSNPALLAYLERRTIAFHYDLKRLYWLILTSKTYQLSSVPCFDSPQARANFASYPLRRLDAEVLCDALNQVTGSSDLYTSPIPEPFTYIPEGVSAVALADGSITSPFLALFGRPARATGLTSERINKPSPAQWLYLLNSTEMQRKLAQGTNLLAVLNPRHSPAQIIQDLYLTILSRFPTSNEVAAIMQYGTVARAKPTDARRARKSSPTPRRVAFSSQYARTDPSLGGPIRPRRISTNGSGNERRSEVRKTRADWLDVAWSLINSEEFLYRH